MKSNLKTILSVFAVGLFAVVTLPQRASAIPVLYVDDGAGNTATIADNLAGVFTGGVGGFGGDAVPLLGVVNWAGFMGVWDITVDTGFTKPALGSATTPIMDLHFSGVSSAAGSLTVTFSESGFTYAGGLDDLWGGTAGGTIVNFVQVNGTNLFGLGPSGPGVFGGMTSGLVTLTPADVLTIGVTITHGGAGITTGDKEVTPVPDGGLTLALLGFALVGVEGLRRKFSK